MLAVDSKTHEERKRGERAKEEGSAPLEILHGGEKTGEGVWRG